jgi:hypothetical protein
VRRAFLVAGGALVLAVLVFGVAAQADDPNDDSSEWAQVVEAARQQMASQTFDGVVVVEWQDARGMHRARMEVRQRDGVVEVVNARRTVASDADRVMLDGQAWTTMGSAHTRVPALTVGKYQITHRRGPVVAGLATTRYDAVRDGHPVERLYLRDATGLVLRRETLDANGNVTRAVSFTRVELGPTTLTAPTTVATRPGPEPVSNLDRPFHDPARAGDGFRLLGRWTHRDDLAQLYYSDGVLSVSVFEQPGDLQWSALPAGGLDAQVSGHRARRYALPVGEAWVFQRGGIVYTCVGDAPPNEISAIAADVSRPNENRIERLAQTVVDPFRW